MRSVLAALALVTVAAAAAVLFGGDEDRSPPAGDDVAGAPVERRVQIAGAGGTGIAGTLRLPEATAARGGVPGILIIPGFGPTDRDGRRTAAGRPDGLYRDVSEVLADAGMASFRYDKRGTGQSLLPAGEELAFDDMAADARAGLDFLAGRSEVDGEALAVVGHDEGALLAMRLAASDPRVRALVLISAPGRPLVDVLADDFAATHGQPSADRLRETVATLVAAGTLPAPDTLPTELRDFFPRDHVPYLRQIFSVDPLADARRVDVPALVVYGGRATFATQTDAERLVEALGGPSEVVVAPGAGPTLATAAAAGGPGGGHEGGPGSAHQDAAAARPERDRDALERISSWLGERLGAATGR